MATTTRRYFGTDGIRAPYGSATMNENFAARLGSAAARWALSQGVKPQAVVLIGRDTRASGPVLEAALASGLASAGLTPISLGVLPTPAVSLAVRERGAALGVAITASHNPAADNGIKFFGSAGTKLTDEQEACIEAQLPAEAPAKQISPLAVDAAASQSYVAKAAALLPPDSLRGWRIVLDTAHGAACQTSPAVLRQLGAEVLSLGAAPDGTNINAGLGSEHPEAMCAEVRAAGARLGIAHDGDADRCILCDERGDVLDGDEILTILAVEALCRGVLAQNTLVVTVQSNLGVDAALAAAGGRVERTAVGDRYVIERMLATGAMLGGESSGHVICAEVSPTGDGLVAALKVLGVMLATGRPLSELRRGLKKFPQLSGTVVVKEKKPIESLPTLPAAIRAVEQELGVQGRVLVRYSGTEPKLRLLVEGPTEAATRAAYERLASAARTDLA